MKKTPVMRKAWHVYEAFKADIVDSETPEESKSWSEKMLRKIIEVYEKHRDSNDMKPHQCEETKVQLNLVWNEMVHDLDRERPVCGVVWIYKDQLFEWIKNLK